MNARDRVKVDGEARGWRGVAVPVVVLGVLVVWLSAVGLPEGVPRMVGVVSAVFTLMQGVLVPGAYVLGAVGWGGLVVGCVRWLSARRWAGETPPLHAPPTRDKGKNQDKGFVLQAVVGIGVMLWLSHALGVMGLLSGEGMRGVLVGWGVVGVGIALLVKQAFAHHRRGEELKVPRGMAAWAVATPGVAVMLVAACSSCGWMWESEFGGYDALSYHLQLPKEWLAARPYGVGRVWPVEHNVYSALPSYMEAAYAHVGAMMPPSWRGGVEELGAGMSGVLGGTRAGSEGVWVYSCQLLHVLVLLVGAAAAAKVVGELREGDAEEARFGGVVAGSVLVGVPWVVVTESMPYNDAAVVAMGAGAMLAAVMRGLGAGARGVLVGFLVGAAVSLKPTAMFMVAPGVAVMMAWGLWCGPRATRKQGVVCAAGCAAAGLVMIVPWLWRNAAATGNPVFPFAAGLFGDGWWSAEQVGRFARAHAFEGSVVERVGMLFSPERGLIHLQWATVWLGVLLVLTWLVWKRSARRVGVLLVCVMGLQVIGWLCFTHVQSRFLLPLAPTVAVMVGLGACNAMAKDGSEDDSDGRSRGGGRVRRGGSTYAAGFVLMTVIGGSMTIDVFMSERGGEPNTMLVSGITPMTGLGFAEELRGVTGEERERYLAENAPVSAYLNLRMILDDGAVVSASGGGRVCVVGNAAALYVVGATGGEVARVVYNTTWDVGPLGRVVREYPAGNGGGAWTAALAERGFGYLLVDFAELHRLSVTDRWYDPEVTVERVMELVGTPTGDGRKWVAVRSWQAGEDGPATTVLYRLEEGGDGW